jgi:hypothetical protein
VDLLDAVDKVSEEPISEAWRWLALLNSYSEKCWRGTTGQAIRVIVKGTVPEGLHLPPRVRLIREGFTTLTLQRIKPLPFFYDYVCKGDDAGVVRDCTAALAELLLPRRPQYIEL